MKRFYYQIDSNNTLTIYNNDNVSIADIQDCKPHKNHLLLVCDVLYDLGYINEVEDIDLIEIV